MKIRKWIDAIRGAEKQAELEQVKTDYQAVERELRNTRQELRKSKEELEDLKLKKKIEEEDIKHLTKIKLEQNEIEFQKRTMEIEKQKDRAITDLKQLYADKIQARLEKETENIKQMYNEILKRLPNINVGMKVKV